MPPSASSSDGTYTAVIATVYNEGANIRAFLESYRDQTRHADEVVIVDGGSNDGTPAILRQFASDYPDLRIRVVVDPTCSRAACSGPIARGRNVAIRHSTADVIAVTDAGCILSPRWFEAIAKPLLADRRIDVVSGCYEGGGTNAFQRAYIKTCLPSLEQMRSHGFLPSSRSLAFRRQCWEAVGGYPEGSLTAEDTLFDLRLRAAGYSFVFAEDAVVKWEVPPTAREAWVKHRSYGYGDGVNRLFASRVLTKSPLVALAAPLLLVPRLRVRYLTGAAYVVGYLSGLSSRRASH